MTRQHRMRTILIGATVAVAAAAAQGTGNTGATCTTQGIKLDLHGFTGAHTATWDIAGETGAVTFTEETTVDIPTPGVAPNTEVTGTVSWPRWVNRGGRWVTDGRVTTTVTSRARCIQAPPQPEQPPASPPATPPVDSPVVTPPAAKPCPATDLSVAIAARGPAYPGVRQWIRVQVRNTGTAATRGPVVAKYRLPAGTTLLRRPARSAHRGRIITVRGPRLAAHRTWRFRVLVRYTRRAGNRVHLAAARAACSRGDVTNATTRLVPTPTKRTPAVTG